MIATLSSVNSSGFRRLWFYRAINETKTCCCCFPERLETKKNSFAAKVARFSKSGQGHFQKKIAIAALISIRAKLDWLS